MAEKKSKEGYERMSPKGTLFIIGGAEDKGENEKRNENEDGSVRMEVLTSFTELLPEKDAVIEVITTAGSAAPLESFKKYKKAFAELSNAQVNQIHHDAREELNADELKDRIMAASAIFFAGGDQLKLTSIYGGTEFLRLLKERYIHEEIVIAGTSAGAMAMSTPMIFGGVGRDEMIAGNVKVTTGLEFLRDVCIDTHFVNRGRFVRIAQVITENPSSMGLGIEEDTAVIVRNGVDMEVVGCGVIIIIDGHHSYGSNITDHRKHVPLTVRGLQVDILSKGQVYSIPQYNPPHL